MFGKQIVMTSNGAFPFMITFEKLSLLRNTVSANPVQRACLYRLPLITRKLSLIILVRRLASTVPFVENIPLLSVLVVGEVVAIPRPTTFQVVFVGRVQAHIVIPSQRIDRSPLIRIIVVFVPAFASPPTMLGSLRFLSLQLASPYFCPAVDEIPPLVLPSILSPFSAISPNLLPTKICRSNFGDAIAVASAKFCHVTVGMVEIAPFEKLYGKGQSRIITSSFNPSCFKTKLKAANRLFCSAIRETYPFSSVLLTIKLHVEPTIVAEARMNHPFIPNTNPPIVTHVEYPIIGGNETKKVMSQRISQPADISRHRSAAGAKYVEQDDARALERREVEPESQALVLEVLGALHPSRSLVWTLGRRPALPGGVDAVAVRGYGLVIVVFVLGGESAGGVGVGGGEVYATTVMEMVYGYLFATDLTLQASVDCYRRIDGGSGWD
ncbi:hypothetical protein KC323_g73 [Hortaea werneckii]|nr:hypothetical protein KC323_g73 [Hortaea werneckii]